MNPVATSDAAFRGGACPTPEYPIAYTGNYTTSADANKNRNAPVEDRMNTLTQGNVQMNLSVGKTTKLEVLQNFGSPNITTRDASGAEVWSYQRHATVSQSSSGGSYFSIIIAGGGKKAEGFSQSSRTATLIIKFDRNDVVSDFQSRMSEF
jgi:outer membrane protein assembly factor BamE (lipoprotein component of BamABCDE complex)